MPDVVVLLPGITGSVLQKNGKDVWGPSGGAILRALLSGGKSIRELALGADDPDRDDLGDGVTAPALVPDVHLIPGFWKIDGYTKVRETLFKRFALTLGENYFEFPYDWRRDNRVHARRLARMSHDWLARWRERSGNRDAKLVLVGHSMGGVISRHFLEVMGGWQSTRALITFGTPYRGSLNALSYLVNGYKEGPLNLTELLRSLTAVYQLLPIYECVDLGDGKLGRVAEVDIPNVDRIRAKAALDFHRGIETEQAKNAANETYVRDGYHIWPIVGIEQPTSQTARITGNAAAMQRDDGGDGTVPRVSAIPIELSKNPPAMYAAERHGSLQNFDPVLVQLEGVLTQQDLTRFRAFPKTTLALDLADAVATTEPVLIDARPADGRPTLQAVVVDAESGAEVRRATLTPRRDGSQHAELEALPAGLYRVTVGGDDSVSPVTDVFAVA